ncbi:MAG: DNA-protecting protein DprA [Candidatus Magasanikbacteria bacterium CG_4_10_14_0_8_um_filter_32_14]|uniref:DNA-protecting protein DprA n=1 Tax=Candidatus Magasanikbacteria bacterium CG_4_10_14_0_8_um_filter_32_14 TaxID=1974640 RepID=A0A2M7RAC8_9BACT|nr:MAG: DNA-protecting protein DprA [Candidatus Magasanikbacteria bacterium CG_4_10_14_0_8_um_filter_32_14]
MQKEILLAHFPKITVNRYQQLLAAFSSLDEVWEAEFDELLKSKIDEKIIHEFLIWKEKLDEEKIYKILEQEKINCVTLQDKNYPKLLKEIYDPPFCLFVRGDLRQDDFNLAVVGTRKYSTYGKQVTENLVADLARQGVVIVSGLAFGIDIIAHITTLQNHGKTIAVLGSGINKRHIYPGEHRNIAQQIIESNGALISEYPPGTLPNKFTFPRRNRIIAGMSLGTLVIEAAEKSGALITAECAMEAGREVFAIPQNITSLTSQGPNNLIKNGAKLVTTSQDILEGLDLQDIEVYVTNKQILGDSPQENAILTVLSQEPHHIDEITKTSGLSGTEISSTLTIMEMKGKVRNLGNMMYVVRV